MTDWGALRERIIIRSVPDEGCWQWAGSLDSRGYARIAFRNRNCKASRVSWCAFNEREWPREKHALHSCDNPRCVNPAHIRPGTPVENGKDASERRRFPNQRKTHCPQGHEYTPGNTRLNRGRRVCRECARIRSSIDNHRRRNARPTQESNHGC